MTRIISSVKIHWREADAIGDNAIQCNVRVCVCERDVQVRGDTLTLSLSLSLSLVSGVTVEGV